MLRKQMLVFMLLFVTSLYAQEQDHRKGSKGLSFLFNGFNANHYDGGVGGKLWLSEKTNLNGNIIFNRNSKVQDGLENHTDNKDVETKFKIRLGLERHFSKVNKVSPFWGLGLGLDLPKRTIEPSIYEGAEVYKQVTKTIGYELFSTLGAEYRAFENMSFSVQHCFQFKYNSSKLEEKRGTITTESKSHWSNLGFGESSLILTIYF